MRIHKAGLAIITILFLCLAAPAAFAQSTLAVKAGLNISNISQDTKFDEADQLEPITGLMAGVSFSNLLNNRMGYQVEALLTRKGNTVSNPADNLDDTLTLTYLEIPVLANVGFEGANGLTFRLHAGPSFGIRVGRKERNNDEPLEPEEEIKVKRGDVGLAIGGQIEKNRWLGGVRYTHGLTNIFNDDPEEFGLSKMKNKVVTIFVGYAWR